MALGPIYEQDFLDCSFGFRPWLAHNSASVAHTCPDAPRRLANSSLAFDRGDKSLSYARDGIVCYWIVNLVHRQVEVYTDPTGPAATPAYRQRTDYRPGDSVPLVIGGQQAARIPVADLLP